MTTVGVIPKVYMMTGARLSNYINSTNSDKINTSMEDLIEFFLLIRAHNIKTSLGWEISAISSHEHGQEKNSDTGFYC
jgi:hypothetical protein